MFFPLRAATFAGPVPCLRELLVVTVSGKVLLAPVAAAAGGCCKPRTPFRCRFSYGWEFAIKLLRLASPALVASYVEDGGVDVNYQPSVGFASDNDNPTWRISSRIQVCQSSWWGSWCSAVAFHAAYAFVGKVPRDARDGYLPLRRRCTSFSAQAWRGRDPDVGIVRERQPHCAGSRSRCSSMAPMRLPEQLFPFGGGEVVFRDTFVAMR